jgi:hypothetical protein
LQHIDQALHPARPLDQLPRHGDRQAAASLLSLIIEQVIEQ